MPKLFIPVGIPGCGKTSWGLSMFPLTNTAKISSDDIREILTGDENDQSRNKEVFNTFYSEIDHYLEQTYNVYADATNLESRSRERLVNIAKESTRDVETHLIWFQNLDEALLRNRKRDRVVPEDVMLRMLEKYEKTILEIPQEEYDNVTVIKSVR